MNKKIWSRIGEQFKQMNVPNGKLVFTDEKRKPKSVHSRIRRFLKAKYNVEIIQRNKEFYLRNLRIEELRLGCDICFNG